MTTSLAQRVLGLVAIVVCVLAPFLGKAFHIDDPLFLWIAQQISKNPTDPYGFSVNWYSVAQPMFSIMQNPPLGSYYLAGAAAAVGWSEPALHLAFLLPAIAAITGTFFVARRLCGSPFSAACITLFAPVFLVSATGVMCDVLMLAFWIWGIECWLRGYENDNWMFPAIASVLIAAAALTKYFGISLVPLLAIYTLVRERRFSLRLSFLILPLLVIAGYEYATRAAYGQGLFSNATIYSWSHSVEANKQILRPLVTGLSFLGGGLIGALFFVPLMNARKFLLLTGIAFVALVPLFYFFVARAFSSGIGLATMAGEGALFAAVGIGILALAVGDTLRKCTAESLLLSLWVVGTFIFAAFMNWSVTSRTILPIAPALGILLARRFEANGGAEPKRPFAMWCPIVPGAILSLLIAAADYSLAETARSAARYFQQRLQPESRVVWFQGHWGFQYYMEKWGARSFDVENSRLSLEDVMIVPLSNTNLVPLHNDDVIFPEKVEFPHLAFLATMSKGAALSTYPSALGPLMAGNGAGVGFYSSVWGPLPWGIMAVAPEYYYLVRIR